MMIENNWAIAGKTAIIYKIETVGHSVTDTNVSVEYKENSSSEWNSIAIELEYNTGSYNAKYDDYAVLIRETPNRPIMVAILNLQSGTTYNVRGCIDNEYINEVSITTITGSSEIVCDSVIRDTSCTQSDFDTYLPTFKIVMYDNVLPLINSMTNINHTFTASLYTKNDGAAAWSNMIFNTMSFSSRSIEWLRSTIIHEMAHNCFPNTYKNDEEIKKFMEFATDCENASWRWLGGHNYPIISSARYDYLDDMLVCYAMQLTGNSWG